MIKTISIHHSLYMQSEEGEAYLKKYDLSTENFDTVVLIENNQIYLKSTAALMIIKNLSGVIQYLHFLMFIPQGIRDFIYSIIAKNRFTFFGKRKICKTNITNSK